MRRRRRPRTGAAGSGSSGILPGPGGPVPVPGEMVPTAPPSEVWGSTVEMLPKMAASAPMVHPEKGTAGTGWIQENPNKVATASSGGVPTVHPGTVSSGDMLDKKAATVGGAPVVHPGKLAEDSGSGSTGDMLQKKADVGSSGGAPMTHPGKGATGSGSGGAMPQKNSPLALGSLSYAAVVARSGSTGDMMQEKADVGSSGPAPMTRPGKGATMQQKNSPLALGNLSYAAVVARSGLTGDMMQKKADVGSSGPAPMTRPGKGATSSGSGSSGTMQQKKADVGSSGPAPMTRPGKGATSSGSGSSGTMQQKKADVGSRGPAPMTRPGKGATSSGSGSSGTMQQKKADVGSSGPAPMTRPGKGATGSGSGSSGTVQQKKVAAASSGRTPTTSLGKRAVGTGLSEEMPQKKATALSGDSPSLGAVDGNTTAQDCEESVAKHSIKKAHTLPIAEIPQKDCTEDKADTGLSGGMLHRQIPKVEADTGLSEEMLDEHLTMEADTGLSGGMLHRQIPKVEADTGLSEEMLHEHITTEADTAKSIQESDSNEIVHLSEIDTETKEAEDLIKKLNKLRIGEPISEQEFLDYFDKLACDPPTIDLKVEMNYEELVKQDERHALCRLRYYQHKLQQASKEELSGELKRILDIDEHDCDKEFLKKEGYFKRFGKDKTFDWSFHRDYVCCSLLVDYQRLVLKNHGYSRWSEYHQYLHSYEVEQEYVNYCEELSKQLKWMEPYVDTPRSSVKWGKISSRGALQAIKIAATSFHKITSCLAVNAYYECKESMSYDVTWFKEFDGMYFEIWRRVTQGTSFEKALEEVYKLNWFPLRQPMMKAALKFDAIMQIMEDEFLTCTEDVTPDVQEDKAKELIKVAVNKRVQKPKSYEQYIRKKIHIAQIIGIL